MSSICGYDLESFVAWNHDLRVEGHYDASTSLMIAEALGRSSKRLILTTQQFAKIVEIYEPCREYIEYRLDEFDDETQSWRDYASSAFEDIPESVSLLAKSEIQRCRENNLTLGYGKDMNRSEQQQYLVGQKKRIALSQIHGLQDSLTDLTGKLKVMHSTESSTIFCELWDWKVGEKPPEADPEGWRECLGFLGEDEAKKSYEFDRERLMRLYVDGRIRISVDHSFAGSISAVRELAIAFTILEKMIAYRTEFQIPRSELFTLIKEKNGNKSIE